ncbi:hypothetical protein M514_10209 [Trichuris suis]|uniref:Uncharacterized protein n=1 Tax=Trichuris suis TaxID=68888 RepID=A0A085N9V8_9BILA|nr:hypothetical protein M513_10209 [Trichuris suis]KFD66254.1 hypothetical protein M514_10209 [Trichuris suis]
MSTPTASAHTGGTSSRGLSHAHGTRVRESALFSSDFTSVTESCRSYSSIGARIVPIRLRINISPAALVFSLALPVIASETHRSTVAESVISSTDLRPQAKARFSPLIAASSSAILIWRASSGRNQVASSTTDPRISTATPMASPLASTQIRPSLPATSHRPRAGS